MNRFHDALLQFSSIVMEWVSDHLKEEFSKFLMAVTEGAVVASFPRQRSIVCLPSEWRVLSKRRSAFSSSRKQIRLSRCSVLFEGDSTLIRPLLRTFDGGFDSFKRVGVCVKEKVQDDHKWWESVLRLRGARGSPKIELAVSLRSLNPLSGVC